MAFNAFISCKLNLTLFCFIIVLLAIFYPKILEKFKESKTKISDASTSNTVTESLYTKSELSKFDGQNDDKPIYISILGSVYDVSKGKQHYGKGCSYNFFAGRDASKSFIDGNFEVYSEDSDDILQLEPSELLNLYNWKKFYDKEYIYKGKLVGRFYDDKGQKTEYFLQADKLVKKAQDLKAEAEKRKSEFPLCNIEWSKETGTKVWCSPSSGGIQREWSGVPRKYFEPGQTSFRCACVHESNLNSPLIKSYDNCDPSSNTCYYKVDE